MMECESCWETEDAETCLAIVADADALIAALGPQPNTTLLELALAIKTKALAMKARHE